MKNSLFCAFIALFVSFSCQKTARLPSPPSFYYWKTTGDFDSLSLARLQMLSGQEPLYVRFFDVDYSAGYENAVPLGELGGFSGLRDGRSIVPVVYLTNRVFQNLQKPQLTELAGRVFRKIDQKLANMVPWLDGMKTVPGWKKMRDAQKDSCIQAHRRQWLASVREIQLDCDWTQSTRDHYFFFLQAFAKLNEGRRLSCTVRLHQFRDRVSAGIPPVDRGLLMCYNVADPKKMETRNAIFDLALVRGYLKAPAYPLPLDLGLPIFSWGAWFRNGEFKGLLSGWDAGRLSDTALFRAEGGQQFRVRRDTVVGQDYLREGDLLRLDAPQSEDLLAVSALLREKVMRADSRVVFFDWQMEKIGHGTEYDEVILGVMKNINTIFRL